MNNKDERVRVANGMIVTRRRIHEIEQTALNKIGKNAVNPDSPTCSFCGKSENQIGRLVEGSENAKICTACVVIIYEVTRDDGNP